MVQYIWMAFYMAKNMVKTYGLNVKAIIQYDY